MIDSSGNYVLIFNGEIYNFQSIKKYLSGQGVDFKTTGDTEVLLEAFKFWGETASISWLECFLLLSMILNQKKYLLLEIDPEKNPYFIFMMVRILFLALK